MGERKDLIVCVNKLHLLGGGEPNQKKERERKDSNSEH